MMSGMRRVFSKKKSKSISKSIRLKEPMWTALEQLAALEHESANAYIVLILDQYLQIQAEAGVIKLPQVNPNEEKIA